MTQPTTPSIVQTGRRLLGRYMLDRAVVLDRTTVRTAGGTTATWTQRPGPSLPCRFGPVNDREATQATGLTETRALSAVSFPVGTVVAEQAKVRNVRTGKEWLVVANTTPESLMATQVRLLIREA